MSSPIKTIFVPQGAEFKAVQRGLKRGCDPVPNLRAIPMGPTAVAAYVKQWIASEAASGSTAGAVLIMGLCGSLTPTLTVADAVVYASSLVDVADALPAAKEKLMFDSGLYSTLLERLEKSVTGVTGLMCDRVVHEAAAKQTLAQLYGADVVDMEGYSILSILQAAGVPVAMLRVVSDDAEHDFPDLSGALTAQGTLKPLPLAMTLIRQPRQAWRLIRGSLRALQQLERLTAQLFNAP